VITWANWKARIRANAFPYGAARELRTRHYNWILDGLIELQQKVTCLRQSHRDVIPHADTLYHCGATVIPAPAKAVIKGLSTKTADDTCAVVNYEPVSYDDVECYLRDLATCGCGVPELYGYYYKMASICLTRLIPTTCFTRGQPRTRRAGAVGAITRCIGA